MLFLFCLLSILQFLKICPIILPNMPIILLLVPHICYIVRNEKSHVQKATLQCHDVCIVTLHGLNQLNNIIQQYMCSLKEYSSMNGVHFSSSEEGSHPEQLQYNCSRVTLLF